MTLFFFLLHFVDVVDDLDGYSGNLKSGLHYLEYTSLAMVNNSYVPFSSQIC